MSLMVPLCAVLFRQDVLDEIWDFIASVSEGFLTHSYLLMESAYFDFKNILVGNFGKLLFCARYTSFFSHISHKTLILALLKPLLFDQ